MRSVVAILSAAVIVTVAGSAAQGQIGATLTYSSQQLGGDSYQYTFTLNNTGTTDIGTLWVGWIAGSPGGAQPYDLLFSNPLAGAADGWTGFSVRDGIGGYSVEWYDIGSPLPPGQSLSGFTIDTADSPQVMAGPSFLGPGEPVLSSWVYVGESENGSDPNDLGYSLVATTVPEPILGILAPASIFLRRKRPWGH